MAKEKIQLTETETLRLELLEIKMGQAAKAIVKLKERHSALVEGIEKREGIDDIRNYQVNNETGEGVLITQPIGVENGRGKKTGS